MKITKEQLKKVIKEELSGGTGGEANELLLFIQNDGDLYRQQYQPILKNLITKKARGIYNPELAVKLFMYLVDNGAKKYDKEFGAGGKEWNLIFPKSVRLEVAKELRDHFETEAELGNYDNFLPKKYAKKEEGQMEEEKKVGTKEDPNWYPGDYSHYAGLPLDVDKSGKKIVKKKENKFNKENFKEVIEKVLKEASIEDINKELGSFQSLVKSKEEDAPSEEEMGKATQQAFLKGLKGKKLREVISKVLEENSEMVKQLQKKCGGMKKLTEEPLEFKGGQDEDQSEEDHIQEEKGHGKKPIINLPPEYLDKSGKMDWEKFGKEKGDKEESLEEEKIEHRYNAEEDFSEDPHKTSFEEKQLDEVAPPGKEKVVKAIKKDFPKGSASPYKIAWDQYKKENK